MVAFTYELTSHGGTATIASEAESLTLVVTDLDDPLTVLVRALIDLLRGATQAEALWAEEPGDYAWELQRVDDRLLIRIVYYHGVHGKTVFTSEYRLQDFAVQVLHELRRALEEHGLEGYKELSACSSGFPIAEYEALKELTALA